MLRREHYSFQVVLYLNNFSNHWTVKIPSLPIKAFNPIKKQISVGAIIIPNASVSQLTKFTNHLAIFSGPCLFCKNLFIYFFPPQTVINYYSVKSSLPSPPFPSLVSSSSSSSASRIPLPPKSKFTAVSLGPGKYNMRSQYVMCPDAYVEIYEDLALYVTWLNLFNCKLYGHF